MRPAFCALFITFGLTAAAATPAPAGEDKEEDWKLLQGIWVIDPRTYQDEKDKDIVKELAAVRVTFAGDRCTFAHPPGNEEKGTFRLGPSQRPKQIDLLGESGPLQAQGIYELGKGRLKLCWDRQFKTRGRPTRFANGKDGEGPFLLVLVRAKQ
jgi:uncharacterized protein (TIGR03067 family)